jgi:hypothetical protein
VAGNMGTLQIVRGSSVVVCLGLVAHDQGFKEAGTGTLDLAQRREIRWVTT